MDNLRTWEFLQKSFGQKTNYIISFNKLAIFIKQETTIKVPIKYNTHISTVLTNFISRIRTALR
ncbi:Uncharacterised protein [Serratia fonticola]|nr:Uncharacterised protein [Serratia fonticola]